MAITFTPFMALVLPNIATNTSIGTLPQDWALYINSNLWTFDGHDHSQIGNPISSENLQVTEDVDVNGVVISQLSLVTLGPYDGTQTALTSLLSDDNINLWFQAGNGNLVQITNSASVPSDAGGFFGDYVSALAVAAFNGPLNRFTFYGNAGSQAATIQGLQLFANNVNVTSSATMPSNMVLTAENVQLIDPTVDFGNSVLVQNPDTTFSICNVVGDSSDYVAAASGKISNAVLTDPNYIFNFNASEATSLDLTGQSNYAAGETNLEEITFVFQSAAIPNPWLPGQKMTITLPCITNSVNLPFNNPRYNIISAKVSVVGLNSTLQSYFGQGGVYFWRIYVTNITISPDNTTVSFMTVTFENYTNQTQFFTANPNCILLGVVKVGLRYSPNAFFGETS